MNKKELSQIFYLKKELKMWQEERQRLEERIGSSGKWIDGMPRGTNTGDPTGNLASELATCKLMVGCKEMEIQVQRNRVIKYITEMEDSFIRQIVFYRCIECMDWKEVAKKIGGTHTGDSVRMSFNRHFGGSNE